MNLTTPCMNHLYFGDCLDVLKDIVKEHPQPFIDLIYIDPPFNSNRNYNVLVESISMKDTNAQKQAFSDTWSNYGYMDELNEIAELHKDLYEMLNMFHNLKSISDRATAYLSTMAIRIFYMHKLLKDTGSFYLHCDSTMSHYLKLLCDMIFGEKNFQNEIIWKRTFAHSDSKKFSKITDTILFYSKSDKFKFNKQKVGYEEDYIKRYYNNVDNGRLHALDSLVKPKGSLGYFYNLLGCVPPSNGWRMPEDKAKQWILENRISIPKTGNTPRYKRFLDEVDGLSLTNIWNDLPPINSQAKEALGYPTQKPEALLERIIKASSNESDVVADFFCGCGTTIAAAQKLNRQWLGADISHLAVRLIKKRLTETYGRGIESNLKLHGMPKDIGSAKELAQNVDGGRIGFQDWAIEVMLNGVVNEKKSADGGYDGYLTFYDNQKKKHFALIETKSGKLTVKNLREFVHVIETQKATVGVFVCFEENVTREMTKCAKDAGHIKMDGAEFPMDKIQIITIEDLFNGKQPQLPGAADNQTFKKAQKKESKSSSYGLFD